MLRIQGSRYDQLIAYVNLLYTLYLTEGLPTMLKQWASSTGTSPLGGLANHTRTAAPLSFSARRGCENRASPRGAPPVEKAHLHVQLQLVYPVVLP